MSEEIAAIRKRIDSMDSFYARWCGDMNDDIESLKEDVKELDEQVAELDYRVAKLEKAILNLENQLRILKGMIKYQGETLNTEELIEG